MTNRLINIRNQFIGDMPVEPARSASILIDGKWVEMDMATYAAALERSCADRVSIESAFEAITELAALAA